MGYFNTIRGKGLRPLSLRVAALGLLIPLAGCSLDDILEIEDPDVATPGSVQDSTALPALYAGAVADFAMAYGGGDSGGGGGNEGQVLLSGLLSDEFKSDDTFDTRIEIDMRAIVATGSNGTSTNGQLDDAERNLHRARRAAEVAAERFAATGKATDRRRAELFALAGFTYVFFAENYCSGVAFSSFPFGGGEPTFGAPTDRAGVLAIAVERFDSALAIAPAGSLEQNLAKVGKGRALLDRGDRAGAAAAVAGVPTSFAYASLHSDNTARQENGVFSYTIDSGRYGVSDVEGWNGLPYVTDGDPRTPTDPDLQAPFDDNITEPFHSQLKYADRGADVPLATGIEARLIESEAALGGGGSPAYLTALNAARAQAGLTPLADAGTPAARVNQLFKERAYFLWLTAHRLGDLRRLIRDYGRTEDAVFPTGEYFRGGEYGNDVNLPIYVDEGNNPNFTGCLDRAA